MRVYIFELSWSARYALIACLSIVPKYSVAEIFTFGVVPQFNTKTLQETWLPILHELHKSTGAEFVLRGNQSTPVFEEQFLAGEFDFSYMNPYHLLRAEKTQGYIPLVRDTAEKLQGILVVAKNSPIKRVEQLRNAKIAFPSPNALAASLLLRAELDKKYGLLFHPDYVKSHDSVYLTVILGINDAGGGVRRTLQLQKPEIRDSLRILEETVAVNPHPIVAHPRVREDIREKVQQTLLNLGKTTEGRRLLERIPIRAIGEATYDDYTSLRQLNLEAYYVGE